jgi:hypothetical protein
MKKLLLLYKGPATSPDASHEGWPQWFNKLGDKLVDRGLPMAHGRSLHEWSEKEEKSEFQATAHDDAHHAFMTLPP